MVFKWLSNLATKLKGGTVSKPWTRYVPIVQGLIGLFSGPSAIATGLGLAVATANVMPLRQRSLTKLVKTASKQFSERLEHEAGGLAEDDRVAAEAKVAELLADGDPQRLLGLALVGHDDFLRELTSSPTAYDGLGDDGRGYLDRVASEAYELVRRFAQTPEVLGTATIGAVRAIHEEIVLLAQRPTTDDVLRMIDFAVSQELLRRNQLGALTETALSQIREHVGTADGVRLERQDLRDALRPVAVQTASERSVLVISGESGTGKSALALSLARQLRDQEPAELGIAVLNLRHLPETLAGLNAALGAPLAACLNELGHEHRLLVIDGADAVLEGRAQLLRDTLTCARESGVGVGLVTSDVAHQVVLDAVTTDLGPDPRVFIVPALSDDELAAIASVTPQLNSVLKDVPKRSLMRRLVTLDLLARSGTTPANQLSEWDVLRVVWDGLARRHEQIVAGSPEARERVLLQLARAALGGMPPSEYLDASTVDALRRDALLAPPSVFDRYPQFAHDEVRRYATSVLLSREPNIAHALDENGAPRWALSAARLALQGALRSGTQGRETSLASLALDFQILATTHGQRWADVPIEAVLELEESYPHLLDAVAVEPGDRAISLDHLLRVVQQRRTVDGFIEPKPVTPVVRLLLTTPRPWELSDSAFEVIAGWLQALALAEAPPGQVERIELRRLLLTYWDGHPEQSNDRALEIATAAAAAAARSQLGRRRSALPHELKRERYVELLALLGPDASEEIEHRLRKLAKDAPWALAPAVDSPMSAWSLAQYSAELLADLTESYYIDDDYQHAHFDGGIRRHQGRSSGWRVPLSAHYLGSFTALFRKAPARRSAKALNRILNHAAQYRCRPEPGWAAAEAGPELKIELALTGANRGYWDAPESWMWYRGVGVGPYPAMSALQAMERFAEALLNGGIPIETIVEVLMRDCENLAVPGMIMGLLTRHVEDVGTAIDPFLRDPNVWMLELSRVTHEQIGWRASSDGLDNPDRRHWSPRETAAFMLRTATPERRQELAELGRQLAEAGRTMGLGPQVELWAAHLDVNQYRLVRDGNDLIVQVSPPEHVAEQIRSIQEELAVASEAARLQNRYWASPRVASGDKQPPTPGEIAEDLRSARALIEDAPRANFDTVDAATHVVCVAIQAAASGHSEALGKDGAFAVAQVLGIARRFAEEGGLQEDDRYFDFGADRAAALALPALLLPELGDALDSAGDTVEDVRLAGYAVAGRASLETRIHLARGCDALWAATCRDSPCIHQVALGWATDSARSAQYGDVGGDAHYDRRVPIEGDVAKRLQELDGMHIDIASLDAALRATGASAATINCTSAAAGSLLITLVAAQRRAMLAQDERGYTTDERGDHSLAAARALLANSRGGSELGLVLEHLTELRSNPQLFGTFLQQLAVAGSETAERAAAAKTAWPAIADAALLLAESEPNPFRGHDTWQDRAISALMPRWHLGGSGLRVETSEPIDWVDAGSLADCLDRWVAVARGRWECVDDLIFVIRRLERSDQVGRGIRWVHDMCVVDGKTAITRSWGIAEWLIDIQTDAENLGHGDAWQRLVDALVVAGNEKLAPYSR